MCISLSASTPEMCWPAAASNTCLPWPSALTRRAVRSSRSWWLTSELLKSSLLAILLTAIGVSRQTRTMRSRVVFPGRRNRSSCSATEFSTKDWVNYNYKQLNRCAFVVYFVAASRKTQKLFMEFTLQRAFSDPDRCMSRNSPRTNKKGLSLNDNPLIFMARPERWFGPVALTPLQGRRRCATTLSRTFGARLELPTAWFVARPHYFTCFISQSLALHW